MIWIACREIIFILVSISNLINHIFDIAEIDELRS